MRLDVYSHNVAVSEIGGPEGLEALFQFCRPLVEMGLERTSRGRFRKIPLKTYAAALKDRSVFRFHRNQLEELIDFLKLKGFYGEKLTVVEHKLNPHDFPEVKFKWISPKTPWKNQPPIIDYVLKPAANQSASRMVTLQTGRGKTLIAMWCSKEMGLRTLYTFKGGYADKWVTDLETHIEFEADELMVVKGSGGMIRLMEMAIEGELTAKTFIISTRTMLDYLKDHETNNGKSEIYPIPPDQFHQALGIGFHVKDEFHQEFHLNFRMELYTHTLKTLALSATMTSSDKFKNKVYDIAAPVRERNDGGGYHAYISVTALFYNLKNPFAAKYKGGTGAYSHNAYEEYIMKHSQMLKEYFRMVNFVVQQRYINVREEGQKMLIFFASVEMCTAFVEFLNDRYPTLTIARYCGSMGDSYDEFIEADIGVSTVSSAGAAVDIINLRLTFMTTAMDSRQSNEQALGRTRELADFESVIPEFLYLVCRDIDRHLVYHENKMNFFRNKCRAHKEMQIPFSI